MPTITLYPKTNFEGKGVGYSSSNPDVSSSFPNGVLSCKVTGGNVTVYANANYIAPEAVLGAGSYPNSSSFPGNGVIMSLRMNGGGGSGGDGGDATIILYPKTNLKGQGVTYSSSNPDVSPSFPNGVHSCKVTGGSVTVYANVDYIAPEALLGAGSYSDTSRFPSSGVIKSLRIK